MDRTENDGLPEAAAKPVRAEGRGHGLNDAPVTTPAELIANWIESRDIPPQERILTIVESGDDEPAPSVGREQSDKSAVHTPYASPRSWGFDVEEVNRSYALAIWGGKALVVNEQPHGPVNDRVRLMTFESMNSWFANRQTEVMGTDGRLKSVTWAKAWHQHADRRQYDGVEFFPNPDGIPSTPGYLNLWRGFSVTPSPAGSCARLKDHLRVNVCRENDEYYSYLFGWMAHLVQKPRERPGIALVMRGQKGTGKTVVGEVLGSLFAPHYFPVDDARYLTGQFNAHMATCLLLQADEAMWAGDKAAEGRLKGLLTSRIQMIESKGVDPIRMENRVRVIMTSNEDWVVPATGDERRFFVLDVGSYAQQNNEYFAELFEELDRGGRERFLHELLSFDLSQFNIWRIPQTKALLDQKLRSLDPIDDCIFNRLWAGTLLHGDDAWRSVVVRDDLYAEYLTDASRMGIGRKRSKADFGKRLNKLISGIGETKVIVQGENGGSKRAYAYVMPSLDECRAAFDKRVGQPIDWPALPLGESERAHCDMTDDVPV
ncbi:primase-helicase family protein [Bradyrhizobium sp. 62]|uniref:primase-helicase family protein n=1 Tax=Bradyrhizobium sp. 62 TaxID=1043588 RepID=UPI001FF99AF7|nr:primase-helicase family protein [Bradyrhizobium sp. 62]MCK1367298.1 hypothetical protein [Bradyrhizobium sp. 62]